MLLVRPGGLLGVFVALLVAALFMFVVRPAINETTDRAFQTADRALDEASRQTAQMQATLDRATAAANADYLSAGAFAALVGDVRAELGRDAELLDFTVSEQGGNVKYRAGDRAAGLTWATGQDGLQPVEVTLVGPGKLADNVFPIARLRPDAAPRLAAAIRAKAGADFTIRSMTLGLAPVTGTLRWTVSGEGGGRSRTFTARADGTRLERIG